MLRYRQVDQRADDIKLMLSDFTGMDVNKLFSEIRNIELENALHERLARVVDIHGAVDAFSLWLSQEVPHDALGIRDELSGKWHFVCSHHGSEQAHLICTAKAIVERNRQKIGLFQSFFKIETIKTSMGVIKLIILRKKQRFSDEELGVIERGVKILTNTLERVFYFEILYRQSRMDALTGLANRRVFEEKIEELMTSSNRYGLPISLAILDLDNFKEINDGLGHDEGDRILKKVAGLFQDMIRASDLVARLGGDEFAILLPNTGLEEAQILAKRIINAVNRLDIKTPFGKKLGVSVGVSQWDGKLGKEAWLKLTDDSLYAAKRAGRNCYFTL